MAVYTAVKFQSITRQKFQAIRARLRAQANITGDGDTGTIQGSSPVGAIEASFSYNELRQVFSVQPTKLPFLVSQGLFASRVRSLVESL